MSTEGGFSSADWIGRVETAQDIVSRNSVSGMLATLHSRPSDPAPGDAAPLLAHWLCFPTHAPQDALGADGHPLRGGFLPPVPLPRRMWAGGELRFERPLRVGSAVSRRSTVSNVSEKHGRSGGLVFVRVDHEIGDEGGVVLIERQDIVYREAPLPGAPAPAPQPAPENPEWVRRVVPDPILLFRYSALTFNGHRIHYDRDYSVREEGYPGLVVHGPLIATLLLHELIEQHPGIDVATYGFRAVRPIFDIAGFSICGSLKPDGVAHLFVADESGALCMEATATLR